MDPNSPTDIQTMMLEGIDAIFNAPGSRFFLSKNNAKLLHALRKYWQDADESTLRIVLDLFNKEP